MLNRLAENSMRGGGVYGTGSGPRMTSRSATATPTGSPKRRHLPQIPSALQQNSFARVRQVLFFFWFSLSSLCTCGASKCKRNEKRVASSHMMITTYRLKIIYRLKRFIICSSLLQLKCGESFLKFTNLSLSFFHFKVL